MCLFSQPFQIMSDWSCFGCPLTCFTCDQSGSCCASKMLQYPIPPFFFPPPAFFTFLVILSYCGLFKKSFWSIDLETSLLRCLNTLVLWVPWLCSSECRCSATIWGGRWPATRRCHAWMGESRLISINARTDLKQSRLLKLNPSFKHQHGKNTNTGQT